MTKVRTRSNSASASVPVSKQVKIQFEDEGIALGEKGTVDEVDFTGSAVSATRSGNKVTVNVTGGGGGGSGAWGGITGTLTDQVDLVAALSSTQAAAEVTAAAYSDSLVATTITAAQKYTVEALPDANYTLQLSDFVPLVKLLTLNSSSARTLTMPSFGTAAIPTGHGPGAILNLGSADITIVAGAGATIENYSTVFTVPPGTMAMFFPRAQSTWRIENITPGVPTSRTIAGIALSADITAAALNLALGGWTKVKTTTDITSTSTSYADITPSSGPALKIPAVSGVWKEYRGWIFGTSNSAGEGIGISIGNGPTLTTRYGGVYIAQSATVMAGKYGIVYDDEGANSAFLSGGGPNYIFGAVLCSASGDIPVRFRAETGGANSVTVKANSYIEYRDL